ncbi:unnamed protein product, partial [Ceratitis capitata]
DHSAVAGIIVLAAFVIIFKPGLPSSRTSTESKMNACKSHILQNANFFLRNAKSYAAAKCVRKCGSQGVKELANALYEWTMFSTNQRAHDKVKRVKEIVK